MKTAAPQPTTRGRIFGGILSKCNFSREPGPLPFETYAENAHHSRVGLLVARSRADDEPQKYLARTTKSNLKESQTTQLLWVCTMSDLNPSRLDHIGMNIVKAAYSDLGFFFPIALTKNLDF